MRSRSRRSSRADPDTLIVVTADHAQTSQIVAEDSSGTGNPTGYSNDLVTADDQVMRVTYGTASEQLSDGLRGREGGGDAIASRRLQ